MRRVRQVTNAARRNIGAQSDRRGGQGIIVPSTVRIYLFWAAVLSQDAGDSLFLIYNGELTILSDLYYVVVNG